jgi:hypothetical protein
MEVGHGKATRRAPGALNAVLTGWLGRRFVK